MLSIAHGPTGAFIASKIPNPFISIPLCVAAHFLEDSIPHWDVGQGLTKKTKSKKAAFIQELGWDLPLSAVIVYFLFQNGRTDINYIAWLGWFFGLFPDFLEFPYLFLNWRFEPVKTLAFTHNRFHHSIPHKFRGLLPQLIILVLIFLFR